MRIPFIDALNERRRRRNEERAREREVNRITDAYMDFRNGFVRAFGVPFEVAVRVAIRPHMEDLVRSSLPPNLAALAEGNPAVESNTGDDPGPLVATLSRSTGAYWGPAPEGGGGESTAAFHASATFDAEHNTYAISMLPGTAQVVGHARSNLLTWNGYSSIPATTPVSVWVSLTWTANSDMWTISSSTGAAGAQPPAGGGDLNVPLFKFWVDSDGDGHLLQLIEGAVLLPWTVNALDVDAAPAASSSSSP